MSSSMKTRAAEAFHPGEYVRDEIEARNWIQQDLAEVLGRPVRLVNEIIGAKKGVTPETAKGLAGAFGTSAELWMNLQSAYDLWHAEHKGDLVARRAKLYSRAPVREMVKRGWIEPSESIEVLEKRVCKLLEISSVGEVPKLAAAIVTKLFDEDRTCEVVE